MKNRNNQKPNLEGQAGRQQYAAQIEAMARKAADWRRANPGREAKVQFNFPAEVFFISSISEAVKKGLVSANDAGLELVKALGSWEDAAEPSVFMVRMALELPAALANGHELVQPIQCPACGRQMDMVSGLNATEAPRPGDLNVCSGCAAFMVYTKDGVALLSEAEFDELDPYTKKLLETSRRLIKEYHQKRPS